MSVISSKAWRTTLLTAVCVLLLATMAPRAAAFFVFGAEDENLLRIRFPVWPFDDLDANNDGDISGDDDGIPITLEKGTYGLDEDEEQIIRDAFDVWESVTTAYIAFSFTNSIESQEAGEGGETSKSEVSYSAGDIDGLNLCAIDLPDEPGAFGLDTGTLGVTMITYSVSDSYYTTPSGDYTVPLSGFQIFDADIILNGSLLRDDTEGGPAVSDLLGTAVHEIGHMIGMAHNPMNNAYVSAFDDLTHAVETPVIALRNPQTGELEIVGATPTMFPLYFETELYAGGYVDGARDLAPDDISGVSFLYPRGSQSNFFNIEHEARSQAQSSVPSTPLLGGLIIAWGDLEDGADDMRQGIPLISTMTGLYESATDEHMRGWFDMKGLWKEMESVSGDGPFPVSYTMTIQPLDGTDIYGQGPDAIDSTHDGTWGAAYDTTFISEVFHEDDTVWGLDNRDVGTPLVFDETRNTVISTNTGENLSTMLPGIEPMFGDANEVCPWNVTYAGIKSNKTPTMLRGLRDNVLLKTAWGAALVDVYYQAAPSMARFLLEHETALKCARGIAVVQEYYMGYLLTALGLLVALGLLLRLRRRRRTAVMAGLFIVAALLHTMPADAMVRFMTDAERVAESDEIVQGLVTSVESRYTTTGSRIVTDILIQVSDTLKGGLNKTSTVSLTLPGGQVDGIVNVASDMPTFEEGDEVILYLQENDTHGYLVLGGEFGRVQIGYQEPSTEGEDEGDNPSTEGEGEDEGDNPSTEGEGEGEGEDPSTEGEGEGEGELVPLYSLAVYVVPEDGGTVQLDPEGGVYEEGTVVTLTAVPNRGWDLNYWTGGVADPMALTTTITMSTNLSVTAQFEQDWTAKSTSSNKYVTVFESQYEGKAPESGQRLKRVQVSLEEYKEHIRRLVREQRDR